MKRFTGESFTFEMTCVSIDNGSENPDVYSKVLNIRIVDADVFKYDEFEPLKV